MRITMFEIMATTPPVVIPDENVPSIQEGVWLRILGTSSTPNPQAKLTAKTRTAFLFIFCDAIIRTPDAATVPNISSVAPPSTGSGMIENIPPINGNALSTTKNAAMK